MISYAKHCAANDNLDKAQMLWGKVCDADPSGENFQSYAQLLARIPQKMDLADEYFKKAIEQNLQDQAMQYEYLGFINKRYADNAELRRSSRREAVAWIERMGGGIVLETEAPILGNEVGNSSIETISVFFRQISLGKSLKGALVSARAR